MAELTPRQKDILAYIEKYRKEQGFPPTLRDICKRFEIRSTNGARYHLHRLSQMGYLEIEQGKSRGVRMVDKTPKRLPVQRTYQMPVLGQVPAGPLNLANPDLREDEITVDPTYFGSRAAEPDLFGLKVVGDSMIEEGILNGDIVVVRQQPHANNGDIVVARLNDDATVKRYRRQQNQVVLEAANPRFEPIVIPDFGGDEYGQDFSLLGVVVGLIRSM